MRETAPTRGETAAELWLRNPQEVVDFLSLFLHDRVLLHASAAGPEGLPQGDSRGEGEASEAEAEEGEGEGP